MRWGLGIDSAGHSHSGADWLADEHDGDHEVGVGYRGAGHSVGGGRHPGRQRQPVRGGHDGGPLHLPPRGGVRQGEFDEGVPVHELQPPRHLRHD
eukprot:8775254-Pyramimonas_sp.AAC.1